ncbi:Fe-S cluster biogenesis protein NfuA [Gillisia sp. Hel_I_86]|uniref:NifU family protein n=1 Tax=Gillisia sp. Hel_I_86 TaxID=1249981 RepID=UPI00119AB5AC|nr:NifU family protein [Gillisia sp. Hel_I_86]TVZ27014.1 Fe-S cluster biogenesis protein NfuA [Gillisia sp. Hel_I_86]
MNTYTINIEPTSNPAIVKFETNQFLTRHESFEFGNIEEAKKSPLAQQLFHLPFVKTVFISQNFIAIEKYNIIEWADVQEEVSGQLLEYLNNDGIIIKADDDTATPSKKVPVTVYAETTPNPSVLKFVANKKLVISAAEFKNIDATADAPLAQALFNFPFVKEIFIDENYISINKYDIANWDEIAMELREFITKYIQDGKDIVLKETLEKEPGDKDVASTEAKKLENLDPVSTQVIEILEEYIKPAVASDGGNIIFDSYNEETKTVKVILQGACSGCPSSTATLKNGIETMMRDMLQGKVETVEAING